MGNFDKRQAFDVIEDALTNKLHPLEDKKTEGSSHMGGSNV